MLRTNFALVCDQNYSRVARGVYPTPILAEIISCVKTEPLGGCALQLSATPNFMRNWCWGVDNFRISAKLSDNKKKKFSLKIL